MTPLPGRADALGTSNSGSDGGSQVRDLQQRSLGAPLLDEAMEVRNRFIRVGGKVLHQ